MPDELLLLLEKVEKDAQPANALVYVHASLHLRTPIPSPPCMVYMYTNADHHIVVRESHRGQTPHKVHLTRLAALIPPHPTVLVRSPTGPMDPTATPRKPSSPSTAASQARPAARCRSASRACSPRARICLTTP